MNSTLITEDQNLVDVALQELGNADVDTLFALADANGLGLVDALAPGQVLALPDVATPGVVSYFGGRHQRINTGEVPSSPELEGRYFSTDYFNFNYFG